MRLDGAVFRIIIHFILHFSMVVLFLAGWLACQLNPTTANTAASQPFSAQSQQYQRKACVRDTLCVSLQLLYPIFKGGNPGVADAINQSVQRAMLGYAFWADIPNLPFQVALDTAMRRMETTYRQTLADTPDYDNIWENKVDGRVVFQNNKYLSVALSGYSFTGGAHPNTFVTMTTYDLSTGLAVPVAAMVQDTGMVIKLLEAAFRKDKNIPANEATREHLLVEHFALPANAVVEATGIRFFYNPYELAAYVYGPTDVLLTWEQLGNTTQRERWLE